MRESKIFQVVKSRIFKDITGEENTVPTNKQTDLYIQSLPQFAYPLYPIYNILICQNHFVLPKYSSALTFEKLVNFLESNPLKNPRFYDLEERPFGKYKGLLFYSESVDEVDFIHTLIPVNENFIDDFCAYEMKVGTNFNFTQIELDNQVSITKVEFLKTDIYFMIRDVLIHYYQNPIGQNYFPIADFSKIANNFAKGQIPPVDKIYNKLFKKALTNKISCYRILAKNNLMALSDENFARSIPASTIQKASEFQIQLGTLGPLVYWSDLRKKFIVADDYIPFLALLARNVDLIPAIVMGDFPNSENVRIKEIGFNELLPGLHVDSTGDNKENAIAQKVIEVQALQQKISIQNAMIEKHSEVWIGGDMVAFGLLISPQYESGTWHGLSTLNGNLEYTPWTISHILNTGLVVANENHKVEFRGVDEYLTFFLDSLVRRSGSKYQIEIAKKYCHFVKSSSEPENIPLLIAEYRYGGKERKHKYRLDFAILNFDKSAKIGIEISPWSSHGKLKKTKGSSQEQINNIVQKNRDKEHDKVISFFRKYDIHILTYTDPEIGNISAIFEDLKKIL